MSKSLLSRKGPIPVGFLQDLRSMVRPRRKVVKKEAPAAQAIRMLIDPCLANHHLAPASKHLQTYPIDQIQPTRAMVSATLQDLHVLR